MARPFKKRRGSQGPSKNEEKVLRARIAENRARQSGALGSRFPTVRSLKLSVRFLDARQQTLDETSFAVGAADAAMFAAPCPGRCGRGSFDFSAKVAEAVQAGLPFSETSARCPEPLYAGSPEACGCEARCRLEIGYLPPAPFTAA